MTQFGTDLMLPGNGRADTANILSVIHPEYSLMLARWFKWRLTYEGGDNFIREYLKKLSIRESQTDFIARMELTYCPAFAKAGLNDIKNAIYQRVNEISRLGGSETYLAAAAGEKGGVDKLGNTMTSFFGRKVIHELLALSKVGIYVDMPPLPGPSIADRGNRRPYLYTYRAEDIVNWEMDQDNNYREFRQVILRDCIYAQDKTFGMDIITILRYRHYQIVGNTVQLQYYSETGETMGNPIVLQIPKIPFVVLELQDSILSTVANYQIAMLNLESSDIAYLMKANFPFYTEQWDPRTEQKPPARSTTDDSTTHNKPLDTNTKEVKTGVANGRRYPVGMERPGFIHPSSEPLLASIAKQERLEASIRKLINLAVSQAQPKMASAESKNMDMQGLEAGLSYIGLELLHAENRIAEYWSAYEGNVTIPTINYPKKWSLKTTDEINAEMDQLEDKMSKVPSQTYKKAIAKKLAYLLLDSSLSKADKEKIETEIDAAEIVVTDPIVIEMSVINGLLDNESAAKALGYPDGVVTKAKADHAERLARIAASQSQGGAARGVNDQSGEPGKAGTAEKLASQDPTTKDTSKPLTRGEA